MVVPLTQEAKKKIREYIGAEVDSMQQIVDEARRLPELRQYVEMHKLSLIDSKFELVDKLLDAEILH